MSATAIKTPFFSTPVLLLAFNRPDFVQHRLAKLEEINADHIFIAVDGPRPGNEVDLQASQQIEQLIKKITWCAPKILLREKNLGCKKAVSSAIDWFFDQVDQGIILEDDCVATTSFFLFCQELLGRYRHDSRVMHISGTNFLETEDLKESYYYSIFAHCWGWATWKRAWKTYDVTMTDWLAGPDQEVIKKLFPRTQSQKFWSTAFDQTAKGQVDTWDYQWMLNCWKENGLCITPKVNLVSNEGFDDRATHTKLSFSPLAYLPTDTLLFPLNHNDSISARVDLDKKEQIFYDQPLIKKLFRGILQNITRNFFQ